MSAARDCMLAARRFDWRMRRFARTLLGATRTTYVGERTREYHGYWNDAAKKLRATVHPLVEGVWEIRRDERRIRIANHVVPIDDPVTLRLAGDKAYCYQRAAALGLPVTEHLAFRLHQVDRAWAFMQSRGGAFVVKPASGTSSGMGISTGVRTRRHLHGAAALASLYGDELLIEAMVPAESCRLLYLDGTLIHAVRRRGVRVVGDGRASIEALLRHRGLARLVADPATATTLAAQGLSLSTCLGMGVTRVVRYLPENEPFMQEQRTVYNEVITSRISPELARGVGAMVRDLGSRFAGVDVLTNDPGTPLRTSGGVFLEINTTPAIHHHYIGPAQEAHPVAVQVLRYLLERCEVPTAEPARESQSTARRTEWARQTALS